MREFLEFIAQGVITFVILFVLVGIAVAVGEWRWRRDPRARDKDGQPANEDRCPWLDPMDYEQCCRWRGHKGLCTVKESRKNIQTGRTEFSFQDYYGINYGD